MKAHLIKHGLKRDLKEDTVTVAPLDFRITPTWGETIADILRSRSHHSL